MMSGMAIESQPDEAAGRLEGDAKRAVEAMQRILTTAQILLPDGSICLVLAASENLVKEKCIIAATNAPESISRALAEIWLSIDSKNMVVVPPCPPTSN